MVALRCPFWHHAASPPAEIVPRFSFAEIVPRFSFAENVPRFSLEQTLAEPLM